MPTPIPACSSGDEQRHAANQTSYSTQRSDEGGTSSSNSNSKSRSTGRSSGAMSTGAGGTAAGSVGSGVGQVPGASAIGAGVGVGLQAANIKDALPDAIGAASSFYHGDVAQGVEHLAGLTDNLTLPGGRAAYAKPQSGAVSSTSGNNAAAQFGRQKHRELKELVDRKGPDWQYGPSIKGKDGRIHRPDVVTPGDRFIELKPRTPTGIEQGARQAQRYRDQLGMDGRVIYYDPPGT